MATGGSMRVINRANSSAVLAGKRKRPKAYPANTAIAVAMIATGIETIALLAKPRPTREACPAYAAPASEIPSTAS